MPVKLKAAEFKPIFEKCPRYVATIRIGFAGRGPGVPFAGPEKFEHVGFVATGISRKAV
jgi:hypothetical protein